MNIKYSKCKKPNICKWCRAEYPNYATIDGKRVRLAGRRYCLTCSPYTGKRNNPRPYTRKNKTIDGIEHKWCPYQKHWAPYNNFGLFERNDRQEYQSYCRDCQRSRASQLQSDFKRKIVEYFGNRCCDCDGVFYDCVYDCHHIDPSKKSFKLSSPKALRLSWRKVKEELDKCVLLCANCHRIRHHHV